MSDENRERRDDIMVAKLIQRVEDYMELTKQRDQAALEWRASIDQRLKPLEDWVSQANWSWKLVVGAVAFTGILFKSWDWVRAHFRP